MLSVNDADGPCQFSRICYISDSTEMDSVPFSLVNDFLAFLCSESVFKIKD